MLFKSFLAAGTFTFAGGIAMLPALKRDLVDGHHYMSQEEFFDYAAMAQAVPGIIGLNFAVLIGKKISGTKGMLICAFASIFPAYILMLLATILAQFIPQEGPLQFAFIGVRAASTSALFMAAYSLGRHLIKKPIHWVFVLLSFIAIGLLNISAPFVILAAALGAYILLIRGEKL